MGDETKRRVEVPTAPATVQYPAIESAAWSVLQPALTGLPSVLDPSVTTWTTAAAEELVRRVGAEDQSHASFMEKLERQLSGAPRAAVLLAAELLFLHCLPLANLRPQTKVDRIELALSWNHPPAVMTAEMIAGLSADGSFNGGTGFNTLIRQQFLWLSRFVAHWAGATTAERQGALADPRQFHAIAAGVSGDQPAIRRSLEYLTWPNYFDPIVSSGHRSAIRKAFDYLIGGPSGNDEASITSDLFAIRSKLDEGGAVVDYYSEPFLGQWAPTQSTTADPAARRAWLVRPPSGSAEIVEEWFADGFVSLAASYLEPLEAGADRASVQRAVDRGYQHQDYAQRIALTTEYFSFLTSMRDDDLVATLVGGAVHVGVMTSGPVFTEDQWSRLRRDVTWSDATIPREELPSHLSSLVDGQGAVVDLTDGLDVLLGYLGDPADAHDHDRESSAGAITEAAPIRLRAATDELARATHIDRGFLQELVDLLGSRGQFVFYGPPGTGKTYLARKLAEHLVGDDRSRTQLVQFHPSYAYEDFFEGYRPDVTTSGQPTFVLTPGPLRRITAEAAANPTEPFVLIIDEMNRANIAKVFGELYFLLEYRDAAIKLQYSPGDKPFRLPPNLFIIATMNTADRSIALVDAAIRRRFPFVELHPDSEPVAGLLRRFLVANRRDASRAVLLDMLNQAFDEADRDFQVGPSYLMRPEADSNAGLERIWRYDILPLITEHYYGRLSPQQVEGRFGLRTLRMQLGRPAGDAMSATAVGVGDGPTDGLDAGDGRAGFADANTLAE